MARNKGYCFLKLTNRKKNPLLKFLDEASTISFQIIKKKKMKKKSLSHFREKVMNVKIPFFIQDLYGKFYNACLMKYNLKRMLYF